MIKDLDTSTRHQDHLKKIKKFWMDENKKYKQNVEHMKEYQEETYKKKNKELTLSKLSNRYIIICHISYTSPPPGKNMYGQ